MLVSESYRTHYCVIVGVKSHSNADIQFRDILLPAFKLQVK